MKKSWWRFYKRCGISADDLPMSLLSGVVSILLAFYIVSRQWRVFLQCSRIMSDFFVDKYTLFLDFCKANCSEFLFSDARLPLSPRLPDVLRCQVATKSKKYCYHWNVFRNFQLPCLRISHFINKILRSIIFNSLWFVSRNGGFFLFSFAIIFSRKIIYLFNDFMKIISSTYFKATNLNEVNLTLIC